MPYGLTRAAIANELGGELQGGENSFSAEQARKIAQAVADVFEKNNREIERELGRRFADIERKIGRA